MVLLKSTLIGKIVTSAKLKIEKLVNPGEISEFDESLKGIKDVLDSWKQVFSDSKKLQVKEKSSSPEPVSDPELPSPEILSFDQSDMISVKHKIENTPQKYRDNMRDKFFEYIGKTKFQANTKNELKILSEKLKGSYLKLLVQVSMDVEKSLFAKHRNPSDYAKKSRSLIFNLREDKNN